jgi:2OG-Fe(II) oxygenase superfamily
MLRVSSPGLTPILAAAYGEFRKIVERGEAIGIPETPLGASLPDSKLYRDFRFAAEETPLAIRKLHEMLSQLPDRFAVNLTSAFGLNNFPPLSTLMNKRDGPVLRMTWYPVCAAGEINQAHTDIDLFTILPAATSVGLQVFSDGQWVPLEVGNDEVAVIPGEILEQLGATQAAKHRVFASQGRERISASLFVNASPALIIRGDVRASDLMKERLDCIRRDGGYHD